jgi:hypothetical protein
MAARAQSAGTTLEAMRRRKDAGVTEKRVIYPPGGLTHVSIAGPTTSGTATTGSIERDLSYSASSPVRRQSIAAPPAGVRLVGNPVREGGLKGCEAQQAWWRGWDGGGWGEGLGGGVGGTGMAAPHPG